MVKSVEEKEKKKKRGVKRERILIMYEVWENEERKLRGRKFRCKNGTWKGRLLCLGGGE